jgi:hypothetical protein
MTQRVQTLLEQAEHLRRHGHDAEADAALERAEQIMIRHSIDVAEAAASATTGANRTDYQHVVLTFTGIYRQVLLSGTYGVVGALDTCRAFATTDGNKALLHVVGDDADVWFVRTLLTSLELQAMSQLYGWWSAYRVTPEGRRLKSMSAYKARRQFVSSFLGGVVARVRRAHADAVSSSGSSVVLAERRSALDRYVDATYNLVPSRSRVLPGVADAHDAGRRAGLSASTGDAPLTGGRALLGR